MKKDTFEVRKFHLKKMIGEHEKAIDWHNKEIRKMYKKITELKSKYWS